MLSFNIVYIIFVVHAKNKHPYFNHCCYICLGLVYVTCNLKLHIIKKRIARLIWGYLFYACAHQNAFDVLMYACIFLANTSI